MAYSKIRVINSGGGDAYRATSFTVENGQFQIAINGTSEEFPRVGLYRGQVNAEQQAKLEQFAQIACDPQRKWPTDLAITSQLGSFYFTVTDNQGRLCESRLNGQGITAQDEGTMKMGYGLVALYDTLLASFYQHRSTTVVELSGDFDLVQQEDGRFWIAVTFKNTGAEPITFRNPTKWPGRYREPGVVIIGGTLASLKQGKTIEDGMDLWLGGRHLLKAPEGSVTVPAGKSVTLEFLASAIAAPVHQAEYRLFVAGILPIGTSVGFGGTINFSFPTKNILLPNRPATCRSGALCTKTGLWSPSVNPAKRARVVEGRPIPTYGLRPQEEAKVLWTWHADVPAGQG
ncbi:hypothetical protein HZU77_007525 [Neisseriaceae bacterium TC5R-5]|nr:hypothetical protein [Neisseriaceae bacterium TC5R-5]